MAKEPRPKGYPKLKNYKPSQFMLPTSHYDKKKADRAVTFIENLCHTKGKWAGTPFWLLPWQEQLIRDIFGIVKADGNRQFRTAFVEICKKVGKSELAAAVALYLLYADNEPSAEVYGAAADRQQASIVFDVAKQMVEMSPALMKRSKLMGATKRIVNYSNAGYYQVLSAEVGGKHGFSVSGLVFDEIHTQPNRQLYDVLTKGSSDARQNPLHFIITTAGNDRHSIAYELHTKAVDILEGRRVDPTFYPVVYGLKDDEDWEDEANWYKVNPSLGYTVDIERLRDAYGEAKQNPADEVTFKWLRCNMWVSSTVAWIPDAIYMRGNEPIDVDALAGRDCYAGLDLSSTGDITALVLIFPPRNEDEKYVLLPYFWIPEETIPRRVKANSVPYDIWEKQGYIMSTEGNVIHYDFIEKFIMDLSEKTAKSILISCGARLAPFDIAELRELMSYDELELDLVGDRKTALFVIISDTDDTFNFIVSIMYTQLFNLLCDRADDVYGGRLPIHVRCLLDEFANIGQIPKFEKLIATIRSREISASIILQSKSQLKAIYKDNADTIEGNCDTTLFLGGKEKTTLKEIAEILGKETIDLYNTSDTRGSQRSYGMNYQKTGKELMSQDEIAVMDGGKCILQVRGVRPFFSNKYDICKHKNYKYLSDYDKKNTFDIEKYLSTNLILKPEDEVELYQM